MILDNEEQRKVILQALTSMQVTGNIKDITNAINVINNIIKAVKEASISQQRKIIPENFPGN